MGMLLQEPQARTLPPWTQLAGGENEEHDETFHPWPQAGRNAMRSAVVPPHRLDGNDTHLGTIDEPSRNLSLIHI